MNIIVTGASSGIGYELVKRYCRNKDNRVYALARNSGKLKNLEADCKDFEGELIIESIDLSNSELLKTYIDKVRNEISSLDILVNNAGSLISKPFEELEEEDIRKQMEVNFHVPVRLIRNCITLLRASESAHVVNIGSMGGYQGSVKFNGLSIYSSAKAALGVLTECLAEEYKESNIKFNCLALGAVQTEMLEDAFPGYEAPLDSEEMAEFIEDFSVKKHRYFNGKILPVAISTP